MKPAYYNENNPYSAQWLRNLIAAGHIADGDVDERSIIDVRADDLRPYTQCHFFAGVGVWSHALRLAGWPDDKPVWTGSCPCQPFSVAGAGKGVTDERHLWPVWFNLITERMPSDIFGEQVEAAIRHGWLDLVQDDLEKAGYAFGAICLPAACTGAYHIRQRLWFMANATSPEHNRIMDWQMQESRAGSTDNSILGYTNSKRFNQQPVQHQCRPANFKVTGPSDLDQLANTTSNRQQWQGSGRTTQERYQPESEYVGQLSHGSKGFSFASSLGNTHDVRNCSQQPIYRGQGIASAGVLNNFWESADWLYCRDEKYRPVEPGTFPLADGIANRVGRLRAYGNAIVPQTAAEVISAYMAWRLAA